MSEEMSLQQALGNAISATQTQMSGISKAFLEPINLKLKLTLRVDHHMQPAYGQASGPVIPY